MLLLIGIWPRKPRLSYTGALVWSTLLCLHQINHKGSGVFWISSNTMSKSDSSLIECITFYFQEEIDGVLLHPNLNIVFWATNLGTIGAYDFHKEVRNHYQSHTCGIWSYTMINDNFIEGLKNNSFMKVGRTKDGHLMHENDHEFFL